jgi:hypothetical protein
VGSSHHHSPGPGGPGPASEKCSRDTWWATGNSGGAVCVSQAAEGHHTITQACHGLPGPHTPSQGSHMDKGAEPGSSTDSALVSPGQRSD